MHTTRAFCKLLLVVLLTLPSQAHADESPNDLLVIANMSVSADSISVLEARMILLKKRERFSGGGRAVPLHAPDGSELRKACQRRLLAMEPDEESRYWSDQKIKHGTSAPPEFQDTLKATFKLKDSLGYCFRRDFREGVVKILLVIPE